MTQAIIDMYPVSDYKAHDGATAAWWASTQIFTDSQMLCPSHQAAGWFTAGGNSNAWVYYYNHVLWAIEHIVDPLVKPLECCHARCVRASQVLWEGAEPGCTPPTAALQRDPHGLPPRRRPLGPRREGAVVAVGAVLDAGEGGVRLMRARGTLTHLHTPFPPPQFAKTGNPNGAGSSSADPVWAPYGSAAQDNVAIINITEAGAVNITMASNVRRSFCSFWDFNSIPEWRVY